MAAQIIALGSSEGFLLAVVICGALQITFGTMKASALSAFVPSSVIRGLLAAIEVILILKKIPHLLGHDTDPKDEMSVSQPDDKTTFPELQTLFEETHACAIVIGVASLALLAAW